MRPSRAGVAFVGLGYVGLSTAACLSSGGIAVHGVDVDQSRVKVIAKGVSPIHEAGLQPLLRRSIRRKTLSLGHDYRNVARSRVIFLTVGTPSREDGSIDTSYIEASAREVGRQLASSRGYHLVVVKSTVVPGTTEGVVRPILERESGKRVGKDIGLASNPEFLHEGTAIRETLHPEAIVIGAVDKKSSNELLGLYKSFYRRLPPTIVTTPSNAEMMKYAINSGRAVQLSFVNTVADLCTRIPGCDYDEVRKGLALVAKMDGRYLGAGLGFGGSCVPPETRVVTDCGFKPIASVRVGDRVLSHDGLYHEVTRTFVRRYDGMMYMFRAQGFSSTPLLVTPEHPILSCLRNTGSHQRFYHTRVSGRGIVQKMNTTFVVEPPQFADPSALAQGDFMVLPSFRERSTTTPELVMASARRRYVLSMCPDLMYLFGIWLAEGSLDLKNGEVLFSMHAQETDIQAEIDGITRRYFGLQAAVKKFSARGNSLTVRIKSKALASFLERTFGHRAERKKIPWDWLMLPERLLVPLVRGLWYGDGSNRNTEPYRRFTYATTSCDLADFMELALLKMRVPYRRRVSKERPDRDGVHHRLSHYMHGVDNTIMSRLLPRLELPPVQEKHQTSWFEGYDYVFPIKGVQVVRYSGDVHNLEVREKNSYVVAGATVHNCLPKDSRALLATLKKSGVPEDMVSSALKVNEGQVGEAIRLGQKLCGSLEGKRVAVLGLAFKGKTDDVRESMAVSLTKALIKVGAEIAVYDPVAAENAKKLFGSQLAYAKSARECLKGAQCAFLATGWEEFKRLTPRDFRTLMASPVVVDTRRIYDQARFQKAGVRMSVIGTGPPAEPVVDTTASSPEQPGKWHYSYST